MKKVILLAALVLFINFAEASAKRRISHDDFYITLDKYGVWVEDHYGELVWKPLRVQRGWKPYTNGRWFWSEYGWFWDSEEPFGWIVHHYGRWDYDARHGWIWYPGYKWAPAWVEWRVSGEYVGWIPLASNAHFNHDYGIYYSSNRSIQFAMWNFVKLRYLGIPSIRQYLVRRNKISYVYKYSVPITNYYVYNNVVFCGMNIAKNKFRRLRNNVIISNLNYTNDYRRINKYGYDVRIRSRSTDGLTTIGYPRIQHPRKKNPNSHKYKSETRGLDTHSTHRVIKDKVVKRPVKRKSSKREEITSEKGKKNKPHKDRKPNRGNKLGK
ncbi:MAG: DUF6600 domain-containing protein [Bacteroidota bacterium]